MSDEDVSEWIERRKTVKVVGARSIIGDYIHNQTTPYIEFYTQPVVRFEFATTDEFYDVQNAIRRARWKTIDLS